MTMDGEIEPHFERDDEDMLSGDNHSAIEPVLEQIQYNRESNAPPYILRIDSESDISIQKLTKPQQNQPSRFPILQDEHRSSQGSHLNAQI
jgi:hypothetical protein